MVFLLVAVIGVARAGKCLRDARVGARPVDFGRLLGKISLKLLLRDACVEANYGAPRPRRRRRRRRDVVSDCTTYDGVNRHAIDATLRPPPPLFARARFTASPRTPLD